MASKDQFETVLASSLTAVRGLTLVGIDYANIVGRELPKASEGLDSLPLVVVAPSDRPEDWVPLSAEDDAAFEVTYWVDFVVIASSKHDFASQRKTYLRWREQIRRVFQPDLLEGALAVFDTQIVPFSPFNRSLLNQNYAYIGISVGFAAVEKRK